MQTIGMSRIPMAFALFVTVLATSKPLWAQASEAGDKAALEARVAKLEGKLTQCCARQLRQLAVAMHGFTKDHDGKFPDKPSQLKPYKLADMPPLFICPASDTQLTRGPDEWIDIDLTSSYVFVPARTNRDWQEIVVYEKDHNHGRGRCVLYGDGHVGVVMDDFPALRAVEDRR